MVTQPLKSEALNMSTESELVDQVFACPVCKNNVMDNLICNEDKVNCTKCRTVYDPLTGNILKRGHGVRWLAHMIRYGRTF
jgi:rubredoxin